MNTEDRFWAKVDKSGECWEWTAAKFKKGYGRFSYHGGAHVLAHRYSFELHNGGIDPNLLVLHTCDNRNCVNPAHLYQGTHERNMLDRSERGRAAGANKTECLRGHAYTEENTGRYPGSGRRYCKTCNREKKRGQYLANHTRAQRSDAA